MKVAIVTSSVFSYASLLLKEQLPEGIEPVLILNKSNPRSISKTFRKIITVGVLGAMMGYISRRWYKLDYESVLKMAEEQNISIYRITNFEITPAAQKVIMECEYGISMGNGYIPKSFYSLFPHGMINIHHEILPDYVGAQSVIWPIIQSKLMTGFAIHFVTSKIDKGDIIISEKRSIVFCDTLGKTVKSNYQESIRLSVIAIVKLIKDPVKNWQRTANSNHAIYTTPTFNDWVQAFRNFNAIDKNDIH